MTTRYWRISGYKGLHLFFDKAIPVDCLTTRQLKELIRCLTAKAGLNYEEIVGAYVKRRTKLAHDLLLVGKNGPYPEYSCGNNPHFTAIVVDGEGKRVEYPH